ncbi:N-acetyl-gamma-glutamyl-phosphate reductase [Alteromonas sp. ASW11-130]|uniref:N-acetyl-gamma-glutamyl-phosphate reductase n=1 Tax=Alteromonas sp. ASW11-130 TaxID=3015775 RepID=UPI002242AD30|nr:N-acetyl-gamma-glutamyl-phosphate reductase [Alteromonas sp. ASW11-130]MCW8090903.1 N-acetyl-gamma-glutamyl-phosphate reductase [Alteromonas sp. ASW11-130]
MLNVSIIGASGYAGAQLTALIHQHPAMQIARLYVSAHSNDANKVFSETARQYSHFPSIPLVPLTVAECADVAASCDALFLCTPHEFSHEAMPQLVNRRAKIFDLSGAFRLSDLDIFAANYGFKNTHADIQQKAVYGLAEWFAADIAKADLVAVPGCYPTASLTGLLPLQRAGLLDSSVRPVINAISGVTGAGRKAVLNTSFCEVSLQAYGVLSHRHTPEIESYLEQKVIFTPHLGNFKRGILATITTKLGKTVNEEQVNHAFAEFYRQQPLVRLSRSFPKVSDVANTPFVDVHWQVDEQSGYVVIGCALDNLLKGAASQAVQCANLVFGLSSTQGLLP